MSINYGYFRHRLDATNDPKVQKIIDLLGVEGLGFWWSLVELYGTAYNNSNREDLTVKIHKRVIANTWRKRVDSCDKVLTKLQLSGNLVVTSHDSTYELTIPNFLKYFGSYQKKKQERTLKKRKENKRKEINIKPVNEDVKKVVDYLNNATGKNYKANTDKTKKLITSLLKRDYTFENFTHVIDVKCQEWGKDEKMKNYLRPETLFGSKFESYLNQEKKITEEDVLRMLEEL